MQCASTRRTHTHTHTVRARALVYVRAKLFELFHWYRGSNVVVCTIHVHIFKCRFDFFSFAFVHFDRTRWTVNAQTWHFYYGGRSGRVSLSLSHGPLSRMRFFNQMRQRRWWWWWGWSISICWIEMNERNQRNRLEMQRKLQSRNAAVEKALSLYSFTA